MSEATRSRRDQVRYEPQMGSPVAAGSSDPLAELARLVGQDDPFRHVFRTTPQPYASTDVAPVDQVHEDAAEHSRHTGWDPDHHSAVDGDGESWSDDDLHDRNGGWHASDRGIETHAQAGSGPEQHYYADEHATYPDEAGIADERLQPHYASAAAMPDLWADGEDGHIGHAPDVQHGVAPEASSPTERSAARRPLMVLAAVLLLTGGGLGATFLARGNAGPGAASAARAAPTIMAAAGPTKVKLDDGSATAPEDKDAALLNKNGSAASGPVKVVTSQEQPVDLGQLPKTADLADGARPLPPASANPFPESKKVKTFLVHPDGTMLSDAGTPAASDAGLSTGALPPGAGSVPATIADAAVAPLPATPRTAVKGGTTPRTIASLSADPAAAGDAPPARSARQPAQAGVHAVAKPTDSAAGVPAAGTGGNFGLQLAASPSEADATAAFSKLKKKYPSQLGSYTANVRKSDTGDKPVYRVRVGGMSQDDAKSLCSRLQASGGSCFVVHN
jgi:hypothetical protein